MRARILLSVLCCALFALPLSAAAAPATNHTVTFVNASGQTLWIGSTVNADGSVNFTDLPVLADGQSATVTIPEDQSPNHWRGKFFARQYCSGSGGDFHCLVGDCGASATSCTTGQQPVSLAEFNFDQSDSLAPWYDVSYVDAFSLPVTIQPNDAPHHPPAAAPARKWAAQTICSPTAQPVTSPQTRTPARPCSVSTPTETPKPTTATTCPRSAPTPTPGQRTTPYPATR